MTLIKKIFNFIKGRSMKKVLLFLFLVVYILLFLLVFFTDGGNVIDSLFVPIFLMALLPMALHPVFLGVIAGIVGVIFYRYKMHRILVAFVMTVSLLSFSASLPVSISKESASQDKRTMYGYPLRFVSQESLVWEYQNIPQLKDKDPLVVAMLTPREHPTNIIWDKLFINSFILLFIVYLLLLVLNKFNKKKERLNK